MVPWRPIVQLIGRAGCIQATVGMVHFNGSLGLLLAHKVGGSALGALRVLDLHVACQIHERLVRVVPFLGILRAVGLDDVWGEAA